MSRPALILLCIAAALAGLAAGGYGGAHAYTLRALHGQSTDDASSVLDDVTVLKQLRWGGQEEDAARHLEGRLQDDLERLRAHAAEEVAQKARERAGEYWARKYGPRKPVSPS